MPGSERQNYLRRIPAVNTIIEQEKARQLTERYSHALIVEAVSEVTGRLRAEILHIEKDKLDMLDLSMDSILIMLEKHLINMFQPHLRRVINATGIVLHTNLGRALLAEQAVQAINSIAGSYNNLELDLNTGERGSRYAHVEDLLSRLIHAEAALVVNNNASAVLLVLNTFAAGKEVIVSRGQLVEIGGSFRIPEVMTASGARLVEVGTTNKTHLRDYENAINEETALFLKVHTSNYKVVGFTAEVSNHELVELARQKSIPVVEDLGSGVLINLKNYGLQEEPTVQDSVKAGVDVVTFSGDKLFGGPQAGIIVGKKEFIEKMKKNPLTRALRVDKFTFAALEATLKLYLDEDAVKNIPTLRMLTADLDELDQKACRLAKKLRGLLKEKANISVIDGFSQVGGGAMPTDNIKSRLVAVETLTVSVSKLEERLRMGDIPVLARIQKDQLLLDMRTINEPELTLLAQALESAIKE